MDALVSGLLQTVLGNLNSVFMQRIGRAWGLTNELEKLKSMLNNIQLVLKDAETNQRKSEPLRNWLQKLKDAAYDAENILDEVATEAMLRKVDSETGQVHKLNVLFTLRNPLVFKFRIANEVKSINERLDAIADEMRKFELKEPNNQNGDTAGNRETGSLVTQSEIYGRNEERDLIIEKVVRGAFDHDDLSVYVIWGMGGIGKTTLAQLVYNDERVKGHFELRIWACVSKDFSIQRLIKAIMVSIDKVECNVSELDPLQRLLQEKLRGKRFLLVLDDVWNENLWDRLRDTISCGSKGSVLVVTSRSKIFVNMKSTIGITEVQFLSEEDSWSIFSQRAFATREAYKERIGKEIVKKCGGVPLAVKALGSLMRNKSSESEWSAIQESETWQLLDDENSVLPALRLSYENLRLELRQCFVYCCIFPKSYEMGEDQLIQLWMANGFLSLCNKTDLYLTGRWIFKELIWRSFFQDVRKDFQGNTVCKMHDLMHHLAESFARNETCVVEYGKLVEIPKTLRHIGIGDLSHELALKNERKLKFPINKSLRSLIGHGKDNMFTVKSYLAFLSKQQSLRVLDLSICMLEKLPSIIYKLQHLRYLAIACYNLKRLPESLILLQNLQTLKFMETGNLVELPKRMKCLKNLYFLDIGSCPSLVCTPPGLGELTCLQKLSTFIVGPDAAHHIDQLKDLNLGGELSIRGLDYVTSLEDAKNTNLMAKINLTSLSLSWMRNSKQESAEPFEDVLKGLQPHENLEKININFYQGSSFPKWMSNAFLPNLCEITLESCQKCERLPSFGKLISLKRLKLKGMDSIKRLGKEWHGDDGTFPTLMNLTISDMHNLEEWSAVPIESFLCLTDLIIEGCPKLSGMPYLCTLRYLKLSISKNMALHRFVMLHTSIKSLLLISELGVLPVGLLQNHRDLKKLGISNSLIRTLGNELDNLSALQHLNLFHCSNLEVLPENLTHLNSLESLEISRCDSLVSVPTTLFQGLSSFEDLFIDNCKKLKYPFSGPPSSMPTLQSLIIIECPELEVLPESMEQLTTLRSLDIHDCAKLCYLPNCIGNLQSLSEMGITSCKNLKSLPDSFQSLKSLRKLTIERCPHLEKRCKRHEGEDWPKISHIPDLRITKSTQSPISKFSDMMSHFWP